MGFGDALREVLEINRWSSDKITGQLR
jgi:hypothetical protein